jgi:hypothetical protein
LNSCHGQHPCVHGSGDVLLVCQLKTAKAFEHAQPLGPVVLALRPVEILPVLCVDGQSDVHVRCANGYSQLDGATTHSGVAALTRCPPGL